MKNNRENEAKILFGRINKMIAFRHKEQKKIAHKIPVLGIKEWLLLNITRY